MLQKPLYHGAISIHGCVPSPDSRLFATAGRGTSNIYLIDVASMSVIGAGPNPQAGQTTNPTVLSSGVFVGREPHEPTFARTGRELWVAVRGEDRIAVLDVEKARLEAAGEAPRCSSLIRLIPTLPGPAMVWFSGEGTSAFVISQKASKIEALTVAYDAAGYSQVKSRRTLDIADRDKFAFSPFIKRSPDGREMWVSHKLADSVSAFSADGEARGLDLVSLGEKWRPNHVEFVDNAKGRVAYAAFARVDDDEPGGEPRRHHRPRRAGGAAQGRRRFLQPWPRGARDLDGPFRDETLRRARTRRVAEHAQRRAGGLHRL